MYELRYMPPARKYFKKLKEKELINAYRRALTEISTDPLSGELKTGDLAGVYCKDVYYNRINYEIAYSVCEDEGQVVVIIIAGSRENFYQELKRYMNP